MSPKAASLKKIAIVGRPNTGKSTLFNALAVGERAVTHATAGTTRDTRTTPAELFGLHFLLLDTAGIEGAATAKASENLPQRLNALALASAAEADLLLLVLDGGAGVLPADRELARSLRKLNRPVIPVLNKADLKTAESHVDDATRLGFGEPILLSAAHRQSLDALFEALQAHIPAKNKPETDQNEPGFSEENNPENTGDEAPPPPPPTIAILGKPNTGKSTLINALLRQEAMLTGPEAGLTREAIRHEINYKNQKLYIVDTPGLRKKSRVEEGGLEFLSVGQSLQAAEKADVIVLMVDASTHNIGAGKWEIFEQQDAQIASFILNQFKPFIIALSKWDAVADPEACLADVQIQLHHRLHAVHTPLAVQLSSIKGKGIKTLLEAILKVHQAQYATFSTNKLNNLLNKVLAKKSPPLANGKVVSLKFIRQTGTNPPTFTFWGNRISEVSNSYKQFLRNQLAENLGLENTPVRIFFRANANPFSQKKPSKIKK